MKLADYILIKLNEKYKQSQAKDSFAQFLVKHFRMNGLERYHLIDQNNLTNDAFLDKKITAIKLNEILSQVQNQAKSIVSQMFVLLGQATQKSQQELNYDLDGFYLQVHCGSNAVYLTIRRLSDDNVVSESSYKKSSNCLASRYYDFDQKMFMPWKLEKQIESINSEEIDVQYQLKASIDSLLDSRMNYAEAIRQLILAGYYDIDISKIYFLNLKN